MKITLKQLKQIIKEEVQGKNISDIRSEIEQELQTIINRYTSDGYVSRDVSEVIQELGSQFYNQANIDPSKRGKTSI